DPNEPFNMAYLAVRGSFAVNGVSRLHGEVSRHLFEPLFRRWPTEEVPIHHVTNGIHTSTWDSQAADSLWTEAIGKDRWKITTESFSDTIRTLSDEKIWSMRAAARRALIEYIRKHQTAHFISYGAPQEAIDRAGRLFDPDVLTIGFARRFVAYKRPDLLLSDPDRLARLLGNGERPVQLVIAGKAPPYDDNARDLIRRWIQFIRHYRLGDRVVFLEDYDMLMAGYLVGGVDVWLNTPQRPWEASGTSGMKVLVNGGLNLSELDGWWAEAYRPEVGWALGDGLEHGNDPAIDQQEARALFALLEQEVIPLFYQRNDKGVPVEWLKKVRESMATLTPFFSSNRTVREYTERFYLPAATAYQDRAARNGDHGKKIVEWKHNLEAHWPHLGFGQSQVETKGNRYLFNIRVYPRGLDPAMMTVQLVAAAPAGNSHLFVAEMLRNGESDPAEGWIAYSAWIPATRPVSDYTARIIPHNDAVSIPLEYDRITWQH
ncbi:MAG TPA: alpha-glucan family phosphorylase, partial [Puia sp.]|nr:alpha-glucan family phosphorylase [Puia sp.]